MNVNISWEETVCPGFFFETCLYIQYIYCMYIFKYKYKYNPNDLFLLGGLTFKSRDRIEAPGDSIRDLFIPDRWRSLTRLKKVTWTHHPKKVTNSQNCQVPFFGVQPFHEFQVLRLFYHNIPNLNEHVPLEHLAARVEHMHYLKHW